MKRKIFLFVVIIALLVSAGAMLRLVRFSVINDSDYDVGFRLTYADCSYVDCDKVTPPVGSIYISSVPPDLKTYTYTVLKIPYHFMWWSEKGVCLRPEAVGLTYDAKSDGLMLEPYFETVLRFKQCYNPPQWYYDWLDEWGLDWNYIYHY